jgi:hypothetical protein
MITEQQSYAFDIRDTFFNAVSTNSFFEDFTARKTKAWPVQRDLIPYLGVYFLDETTVPDGDANAGCIRFNHTARIGFSVIVQNNDPEVAEKTSDQAFLKIMAILFTDQHIMNVLAHTNVEGVLIESIMRGTRRHIYGSTGANNETPFLELQYDVSAFYRTEWYPDITDTLDSIHVTTNVNNDTADLNQITTVYDFTSQRGKDNGRHERESSDDSDRAQQGATGSGHEAAQGRSRRTSQ